MDNSLLKLLAPKERFDVAISDLSQEQDKLDPASPNYQECHLNMSSRIEKLTRFKRRIYSN